MSTQPTTPEPAGAQMPLIPFTIRNRTLVRQGSTMGSLSTMHLEEVRDYLVRLDEAQAPKDHDRTLNQLHVDFARGHIEASWLNPGGRDEKRYLMTDTGAGQLAREVLPSRFFAGLKDLAKMDQVGAMVATKAWAKFALRNGKTPRRVRTILGKVNGEVHHIIRSCHSTSYAAYSNLDFVQDILDNGGIYAEMPILDWRVADNGMRLRFAAIPKNEITLEKPVPMVEAWNSETGQSRTILRGGLWRLVCTNGMGSWQDRTEFSWVHSGDAARIRAGVGSAFENLLTTANGVVEAYEEALNISVMNAFAFMEDELNSYGAANRVIEDAKEALNDPTTTPGGNLASVVDAVTLIAQNEADMFQQHELERFAARMLNKGRGVALRHNGRIPVEA